MNKIKINKLTDDQLEEKLIDSDEFLYENREALENEISQETLDLLVAYFISDHESNFDKIERCIDIIYNSIIVYKYDHCTDISYLAKAIEAIHFLKIDDTFWAIEKSYPKTYFGYDVKKAMKKIWDLYKSDTSWKDCMPDEMEEEFKFEHLLEIGYQINMCLKSLEDAGRTDLQNIIDSWWWL